jgi:hypothetical protein
MPKAYERVAFDRDVATQDWPPRQEPEFLAFGHPLLDRMVHYCRVTKAAELGGRLCCIVADYQGLPGVIFNFLLRFEDKIGRIIREELEPICVDLDGKVQPSLGRKLFLGSSVPNAQPSEATIAAIRSRSAELRHIAETFIRKQYQDYYDRVEQTRNKDIGVLLNDLDRFNEGILEDFKKRSAQLTQDQGLFNNQDPVLKGQVTRLENQRKSHEHLMTERRAEIQQMRPGAFPAPQVLNMVLVTKP